MSAWMCRSNLGRNHRRQPETGSERLVEFAQDLDHHRGEDQQHADPHGKDPDVLVTEVEADGQQDHAGNDGHQHGVERRHRDHDDGLVGGDKASLVGVLSEGADVCHGLLES